MVCFDFLISNSGISLEERDTSWSICLLCLPLYRGGRYIALLLTAHFCHISFVSVRSLSRRWPNAGLLLAHHLRYWANISPVLGYRVVFDATLNVGQRHWQQANINPGFVQSIVLILQPAWRRPTD